MDAICKFYEQKLREQNPNARNITYDIQDLYLFIDSFADLGALVFDMRLQAYAPKDKEWIKQRVYKHLRSMAEQGGSN